MRTEAEFFQRAIRDVARLEPAAVSVLDFGCGRGELVRELNNLGVSARGCDVDPYWSGPQPYLRAIERKPYRIPFLDASFDVVVSTSVLEHAQNTEEIFRELHRVLKPGGCAMHIYPGKWYLPSEPHTFIPLVNWVWPWVPRWWLWLWVVAGVHTKDQAGNTWRQRVALDAGYCRDGICYRTHRFYRETSTAVFGGGEWMMDYFLRNSDGGVASIYRRAPNPVMAWLCKHFRMGFLVQRKATA